LRSTSAAPTVGGVGVGGGGEVGGGGGAVPLWLVLCAVPLIGAAVPHAERQLQLAARSPHSHHPRNHPTDPLRNHPETPTHTHPPGMPERKMGMAVGQDPDLMSEVCGWANAVATKPVWAKMTPNITDISVPARAALDAGACVCVCACVRVCVCVCVRVCVCVCVCLCVEGRVGSWVAWGEGR